VAATRERAAGARRVAELRHGDEEAGRLVATPAIRRESAPLARGLDVAALARDNRAAALGDFLRRGGGPVVAAVATELHGATDNPLRWRGCSSGRRNCGWSATRC
jgi:hypothetical protein